jgi:DUF971 family protein
MIPLSRPASPVLIEPAKEMSALRVVWSDGKTQNIPYSELRFLCPCASCVDEHTGIRTIRREAVRDDIKPRKASPVGNYAIQIVWTDGHETGIYSYDQLRQIQGF